MAPKKERPLEIKQFPGIDRFDRGTITPPNFFETLQNYHPKSLGELESLRGVSNLDNAAQAGVSKFIHLASHKDFGGREMLMSYYISTIDNTVSFNVGAVTGANFTGTGGSSTESNFLVQFVGPGGVYDTVYIKKTMQTDSITFTTPAGIPTWVTQINIYQFFGGPATELSQQIGCLIGSLSRNPFLGNIFPSSIVCRRYIDAVASGANQLAPDHFRCESSSVGGGTLANKRTYYFGIGSPLCRGDSFTPAFDRTEQARVRLFTANGEPMAFTMDSGNRLRARFFWPVSSVSLLGQTIDSMWAFIGTTPEDILIGGRKWGSSTQAFSYSRLDVSYNTLGWGTGSVSVDVSGDFIQRTNWGNLSDESPVFLSSSSAANLPAPLTNSTVYWVKFIDDAKTRLRLSTSLADMRNNIFIDLTTTGSSYASHTFFQTELDVEFNHLPVNSNNGVHMIQRYPRDNLEQGGLVQQAEAAAGPIPARADGAFSSLNYYLNLGHPRRVDNTTVGSGNYLLGCLVVDGTHSWSVYPNYFDKIFTSRTYGAGKLDNGGFYYALKPDGNERISSFQSTIRTYLANGINSLMYTNGYVLKQIVRDNGKVLVPTSSFVYGFNSRLVAGGGPSSYQNTRNQIYYSEPDLPFDWGSGSPNTYNVFTQHDVNGFGGYSQNLSTKGFAQFLLISKEDGLFSWDGDTASAPQQLYYGFGMANDKCFIESDFGPIIIGRENIYSLQGGQIVDIGDNVEPILKSLTNTQIASLNPVYHNKIIKIGYRTTASNENIREIWLELRRDRGQMQTFYSGPHDVFGYYDQVVLFKFGDDFTTVSDYRVSASDNRRYVRDSNFSNVGSNIPYVIEISRLSMQADHLWKLITRLDLNVENVLAVGSITFGVSFTFENGTTQYVGTITAANGKTWNQLLLRDRRFGRVVKLALTATTSNPHSIFNISIWHEIFNRRVLRYQ